MTDVDFRQLIDRAESETLDFKMEGYDLRGSRYAFLKDVLSMANTPRKQPAHIVLGVRWTPESGSTVTGLARQYDDVEFQDAFGKQDKVQPNPRFTYFPLKFEGMQVGVLNIPVSREGPHTPVKDYDNFQAGAVYYRHGTQNVRAVGPELKRIFSWFQSGDVGVPLESAYNAWPRLFDAINRLEPTTIYILGADRISSTTPAPVHALGMVPWRAVIDFDPSSEASGLLSSVAGSLSHHQIIHRVVREGKRAHIQPGTHWFFARGLSGRQETLSDGSHKAWLRAYKQELGSQLRQLAAAVSPTPVVALLLWSDASLRNHLRTLIEELHGAFGESLSVTVVSDDAPSFEGLSEEAGATFVEMRLRSLCGGVAVHYADLQDADTDRCVLPTSSGGQVEVAPKDWLWLSEDLELVHRSTGLAGDDDVANYRRGADVSWRNLQLRHDYDRHITPMIHTQVEEALRRRQAVRINLYHAPGSGGTTVGRRVAWDLHGTYPVGILLRCSPPDTAGKISKIAALTERSVLVVIDGGQHSERDIDDLYEYLRAAHTPAVLLQVLRRFRPQMSGKWQFRLDAELNDVEADRFRTGYAEIVPLRTGQLNDLARLRNNPQRNAFFFGLTAFGKDFRGLSRYVESRISILTDDQKRILLYIAMAHYYGQQSVPAQAFAFILGLPRSKTLSFSAVFADSAAQALELLIETRDGEWRTVHHLVALEIMQQILVPGDSKERETVWRQNLSSCAKDFASFCRGEGQTISDRLLELVRRVFVYRDNIEMLGTERAGQNQFAHLIEDIRSDHGKIEVLRHLTACFPFEAHFHAHLGRFLGRCGEYEEGIKSVESAISLQPEDPLLHHMRGMVLRRQMRAEGDAGAAVDGLVEIAKRASESFEESRRRSPDTEHSYISEVQMLVDLLDRLGSGREDVIRDVLAQPDTDPFVRLALERAEDLLGRVQDLYAGEPPSGYVLDCRAKLQRIYGDYQTALQAWDSLLSRPDVARSPVRRQIVWTILRRRNGAWDQLNAKEVVRVRQLLEENLEEEVKDSTSLRLWLRAIRESDMPPSLDSIIEKVGYWKANTGALDAAYYLYVLHTLRALKGSSQGAADADQALEECRAIAQFRRDRTRSFEWIGDGEGVQALVHQSRLGEWKEEFWEFGSALARLSGRIKTIAGPQKGIVELEGGVCAFFVPARSDFNIGRDENTLVNCYLGFSYDGPRAWDVKRAGT